MFFRKNQNSERSAGHWPALLLCFSHVSSLPIVLGRMCERYKQITPREVGIDKIFKHLTYHYQCDKMSSSTEGKGFEHMVKYVLTESEYQQLAGMLQSGNGPWGVYARRAPFDAVSCYLDRVYGLGGKWINATGRRRRPGRAASMDYSHFFFMGGRVE